MTNEAATNAIGQIIITDAAEWLKRERAGRSASMNGALDYTALRVIEKLKEMGWRGPADEGEDRD